MLLCQRELRTYDDIHLHLTVSVTSGENLEGATIIRRPLGGNIHLLALCLSLLTVDLKSDGPNYIFFSAHAY